MRGRVVFCVALALAASFAVLFLADCCSGKPQAERGRAGLGWDYTDGHPLVDCALSCRAVPYADLDPKADVLIVGAGLSGAILAHLHATLRGETVLIVERRNHIAGNMYDYVDSNGMRSSMYGPHYFHTNDERVWQFLNRFSPWHYYEYRVVANVTDINGTTIFPTIPINIDTANRVFGMSIQTREEMERWLAKTQDRYQGGPKNAEEAARERVGKVLYEKFFEGYTTKQWERQPRDLYPSVTQRIPVWSTHDDRYFNDAHQAKPEKGFTELIRPMLTHPKIRYLLNTDFFVFRKHFDVGKYKKVFYTGPIDQYFADQGMATLEYRSLTFRIVRAEDVDRADGTHKGHPWARCESESGRAYAGRVLRTAGRVPSPEQCCARCSNTAGCRFWTHSAGSAECALMATQGTRRPAVGAVSGSRLGKTFQPATTLNQPSVRVPHTRSCEYKWLPWDHMTPGAEGLPHTSLFYEYPSSTGEPYYPIPNERNVNLYRKYQKLAEKEEKARNVHFVGRLANYKYFNMDQTAANALKVYERVYPDAAPVVPVNAQSIVVVTVLRPSPGRYAEAATGGHWSGLCRLAQQVADNDDVLWLIVDEGHETGDANVKKLLRALGLPPRSAYFYGNGAERGRDLAFDYIRLNRISGTVYTASPDDAHSEELWRALRRRERGRVGVLPVGVGGWDAAHRTGPRSPSWPAALAAGVAFDASLLYNGKGSWPASWVQDQLPAMKVRDEAAQGATMPPPWQCLPDPHCGEVLVAVPAANGTIAPARGSRPSDRCGDVPGEHKLLVVQL